MLEGAKLSSAPDAFQIKETVNHDKLIVNDNSKSKATKYGLRVWTEGKAITNTPAEKYLQSVRGVTELKGADLRYHQGVFSNEMGDKKYTPALLASFKDSNGAVKAVEVIYLDKDGNKAKNSNGEPLSTGKRTYGTKSGAMITVGHISEQNKHNASFVAEGVVTALSVKQAFKDEHVVSTGGIASIKNIPADALKDHVVICADNDGKDNSKIINEAVDHLQKNGKSVYVVEAKAIDGIDKVDFNDTLKHTGVDDIRKQFEASITKIDNITKHTDNLIDQLKNMGSLSNDQIKSAIDYAKQSGQMDVDSIMKHVNTGVKDSGINISPSIAKSAIEHTKDINQSKSISTSKAPEIDQTKAFKQMVKYENEITK